MGVYAGRTTGANFLSVIHSAMIAEGYTEVSSNVSSDGRVYKSTEGGNNEFYIQLKESGSNYLIVGYYEKYTPGAPGIAGVFGPGVAPQNCISWNKTAGYLPTNQLSYIMNINLSRVIIQCEGFKIDGNFNSSLTYVGIPVRYDPKDLGSGFGGIAGTSRTDSNMGGIQSGVWQALRGRNLNATSYQIDAYWSPRSYGWGGLFFSPMFIGNADEGPRGEIDGIYTLEPGSNFEFQHYDTFKKDGKSYIILSTVNDHSTNSAKLPRTWYVMEVAEGLNYGLLFR